MIPCFADTSYFLAMLVPGDENHAVALRWTSSSRLPLLTTEYVLLEVANYLSARETRRLFGTFASALHSSPNARIVPTTSELTWKGIDLFNDRPDKSWSLTDCISFMVMRESGLTEALTISSRRGSSPCCDRRLDFSRTAEAVLLPLKCNYNPAP